jgi:hypothetical protein
VAPWLAQGYQDYASQIGNYANTDSSSYVAGQSDLQGTAFSGAQNLGGWQNFLNKASDATTGVANAGPNTAQGTTSDGVSILGMDRGAFTNPYTNDVVNTTLAGFDKNAGGVRAAQDALAAKNHAFGGSRFGIQAAETEGNLARERAASEAGLRDAGFNQATAAMQAEANRAQQNNQFNAGQGQQLNQFNAGQMDQDQARQLQAAQLMANFGSMSGDQGRADVATQLGAGEVQHQLDQDQLNALPDWLKSIGAMYGSIPTGAFTSMNTTGNSTGTGSTTGKTSTSSISAGWSPTTGFSFGG